MHKINLQNLDKNNELIQNKPLKPGVHKMRRGKSKSEIKHTTRAINRRKERQAKLHWENQYD